MKQSDIFDFKRIESWMKSSLSSKEIPYGSLSFKLMSLKKWFEYEVFDFQFESPGHQHVHLHLLFLL